MNVLTDNNGNVYVSNGNSLKLPDTLKANVRCFTCTVSAASDNVTLVSADPDIAAHYDDDTVNVIVFPITNIESYSLTTAFSSFVGSNSITAQGFRQHWRRLGEHTSYRESVKNLHNSTGADNFFKLTSTGDMVAFPWGGGQLEAATYQIIFMWGE